MSVLKQANEAFKCKDYSRAILLYEKLIVQNHQLAKVVDLNLKLAKQRRDGKKNIDIRNKSNSNIVMFWKQNDSGLYGRRSDMVAKYLASRADVDNVVMIDMPISSQQLEKLSQDNELTHSRIIATLAQQKAKGTMKKNGVDYRAYIYDGHNYSGNLNHNETFINDYLNYLTKLFISLEIDITKTLFWICPKNFLAEKLIDTFNPAKVVVDIIDDHRAWPNVTEIEKQRLTEHYRALLKVADFPMANCQPVFENMKFFNSNIKLVPNGYESEVEIKVPDNSALYTEMKNSKKKIIGFVGNLELKIDIELISQLAEALPETLIILIGSTHANPEVRALKNITNIRIPGVIPYDDIYAYINLFDVAILPHKDMALTQNMNPLKAYVYLRLKKQIVATKIENLPAHPLIMITETADQFIEAVKACLIKEDLQKNNQQVESMDEYTWAARLKGPIDQLIMSVKA